MSPTKQRVLDAALDAHRRGYVPIPVHAESKRPGVLKWEGLSYADEADLLERVAGWYDEGMTNLGILNGEPSGWLVDVDIDHPSAWRLRSFFLPRTVARHGRNSSGESHYWYRISDDFHPSTRQHMIPSPDDPRKRVVSVELRSSRSQTVIAPSMHPSGDEYRWEAAPWGGERGPAEIEGRQLAAQVALLGFAAVILDNWPTSGGRHEAYNALAGWLLKQADGEVSAVWRKALPSLIRALAEVTHDEDGGDTRVAESYASTIAKIERGDLVTGAGRLTEILGEQHMAQARVLLGEVEQTLGAPSRNLIAPPPQDAPPIIDPNRPPEPEDDDAEPGVDHETGEVLDNSKLNPLESRSSSWEIVNFDPYLDGEAEEIKPTVFHRNDGAPLMYAGRLNMIYGSSESAKSWVALRIALQRIELGERVLYLDLEDEPQNTSNRLLKLGGDRDAIRKGFAYMRPEDPLAAMERDRWGKEQQTSDGQANEQAFLRAVAEFDPSLIIVDGMTVLYGLHGLDTNSSTQTDVITKWLKTLNRSGRSTVIIIDHSGKSSEKGSLPIGSQHKVSMVQGTLLQVWPIKQPMPGQFGELELYVLKDRPGGVREMSSKPSGSGKVQTAARITMDSTNPDRKVRMEIEPPKILPPTVVQVDGEVKRKDAGPSDAQADAERKRKEGAANRWADRVDAVWRLFGDDMELELSRNDLVARLTDGGIMSKSVAERAIKYATEGQTSHGAILYRTDDGLGGPGARATFRLSVAHEGLEGYQPSGPRLPKIDMSMDDLDVDPGSPAAAAD